jgi:hypothetical protein
MSGSGLVLTRQLGSQSRHQCQSLAEEQIRYVALNDRILLHFPKSREERGTSRTQALTQNGWLVVTRVEPEVQCTALHVADTVRDSGIEFHV